MTAGNRHQEERCLLFGLFICAATEGPKARNVFLANGFIRLMKFGPRRLPSMWRPTGLLDINQTRGLVSRLILRNLENCHHVNDVGQIFQREHLSGMLESEIRGTTRGSENGITFLLVLLKRGVLAVLGSVPESCACRSRRSPQPQRWDPKLFILRSSRCHQMAASEETVECEEKKPDVRDRTTQRAPCRLESRHHAHDITNQSLPRRGRKC